MLARDSLPRVHDVGPDGTAIPHTSTPLRDARSHDEAPPAVGCMAMRPLRAPGSGSAGLAPGPDPRGAPAGSGG
jgi:hypothetical protein